MKARSAYGMRLRPTAYVAGSRTELGRVRAVASQLAAAGFALPLQWWEAENELAAGDAALTPERAYDIATTEQVAVLSADVVVVLVPPPGAGRGCFVELGMALGAGCPVVMAGEHAKGIVFWALADTVTKTDDEAIARAIELCATELVTATQLEEGAA